MGVGVAWGVGVSFFFCEYCFLSSSTRGRERKRSKEKKTLLTCSAVNSFEPGSAPAYPTSTANPTTGVSTIAHRPPARIVSFVTVRVDSSSSRRAYEMYALPMYGTARSWSILALNSRTAHLATSTGPWSATRRSQRLGGGRPGMTLMLPVASSTSSFSANRSSGMPASARKAASSPRAATESRAFAARSASRRCGFLAPGGPADEPFDEEGSLLRRKAWRASSASASAASVSSSTKEPPTPSLPPSPPPPPSSPSL